MKHRKYSFLITIVLCIALLTGHLSFSSYAAGTTARRSRLSGVNAALYDALASKISKVASGELASSSFSVTISLKKALGSAWKDSYSASDLGVSTLITGGSFTTETVNALDRLFNYKPDLVIEYLLSDMPYELYWFDKTSGWSGPGNISAYNGTSEAVTIRENATLVFDFFVSLDYSMTPVVKTTAVNTTKTTAAKNAMAKAREIIDKNKSKSDYEKLKAYKEEICNLASYDTAAAGNSSSYGDSHQIINVFDGNVSTKVVCEGYSKAFKYLCDNTTFSNSSINCQIVTGTMAGGLGAGAHMWNVVHMNDGKNYIVDVTNCDTGTIGAPNKLFLTGASKLSANKYQAKGAAVQYTYDKSALSQFTAAELAIAGDDFPVPQSDSGNSNSGSSNSGNNDSGNSNSGSNNSGNNNSGNGNSGNNNSGESSNSGTGENNSGNNNSSIAKIVHVYFNANGGTVFFQQVDVVVGQKYGFLPYAYRTGYEFLGWFTSVNNSSDVAVTTNTICNNTHDHILHAHWRQLPSDGSDNIPSDSSSNNGASNNSSNNTASNNSSESSASDSPSSSQAPSSNPVPNPNQGYSDHPEGSSKANQDARKQRGPKSSVTITAGGYEISISKGKVTLKSVSTETVSSATYTEYSDGKLKLDKPKTKAKSIYIPSKIAVNNRTYKVTQIGNNAFRNNKKVTKITLPSTLKKVEKGAFKGASKLKTITIKGGSKKNFKKIVKLIKSSSSNTRRCRFVHVK